MTAVLSRPSASMSQIAPNVYPDHHLQHSYVRPPLLPHLPNHAPNTQTHDPPSKATRLGSENEVITASRSMEVGMPRYPELQHNGHWAPIAHQPSQQNIHPVVPPISHSVPPPSQYSQTVAPVSRGRSPIDLVSPKQVEFKQEPDMYQADTTDQIALYLQIPSEINASKGSLSDLAAQITCLFWFESSQTLLQVEEARSTPLPSHPLIPEANPTIGFRKWVTTILSTTQVSANVVLLALMFVYRLKKMNPSVRGKPGSEYRLLTVALMLGNKFLDDNTYTNKTWAEVSGITVAEIHVMEVEFLSNMRYTLYASKEEWKLWIQKLRRFAEYFVAASKAAEESQNSIKQITQQTPLPTPALPAQVTTPTRVYAMPAKMPGTPTNRLPYPLTAPVYTHQPSLPPAARVPEYTSKRKRSYDEEVDEHPAKRLSRNFGIGARPEGISPAPTLVSAVSTPSTYDSSTPRTAVYSDLSTPRGLPMPIMTNPQMLAQLPSGYPHPQPHPSRAMATVYPPPLTQAGLEHLKPQAQIPPPLGLRIPPLMDPSQSLSAVASKNNSPLAGVMTPTTELLSPMVYGHYRSSPYKPVRTVNSLLAPPPLTSLGNPANSIGSSDLHYRPLGKQPGQSRVGVVPHIPLAYAQQHHQQHWPYHHPTGY